MRKFFFAYMPASLLLVFLAMILWTCGGGGGGGGGGITTSTFTGSVSGTIVLAVDENGTVAAQDDTSGKTPIDNTSIPPRYPFTLTVPAGHQYTIYFVVTAEDRIVPLFSGTTNIFSVTAGGTIDLGYVDTTQAKASAGKDPLATAGVTSGGATGDNTIKVEGYKWLILMDRLDVGKKYRTQVQVKNPDDSVLTDSTLVKDVVVYGPDGQELPLEGSFIVWNGATEFVDTGSGPTPNPQADIEAYLIATPGSLPDGFYTEVITDSNRNLHLVKFWHEQPTEVGKPTNLAQSVNSDNSITLSWTNPAGISGPLYFIILQIRHSDENGDGESDLALNVSRNASTISYTIPAWFVSSNLAGKQELKWVVQVRQETGLIDFPDGTRNAQIYRNYSADQQLSVATPPSIRFTSEMLAGKVFFREFPVGFGLYEFSLFFFNTDFSFRNSSSTNALNPAVEILNGTWSIDASGRMIVKIPGFPQDVIGTLLSDSPTEMQISVEGIDDPGIEIFQKTVPIDPSKLPGTYTEPDGTLIINPGGTGSFNGEPFTWSVDSAGVLTIPTPTEKNICYALASSSSTATSYTILKLVGEELNLDGSVHNIFKVELTRNP